MLTDVNFCIKFIIFRKSDIYNEIHSLYNMDTNDFQIIFQ